MLEKTAADVRKVINKGVDFLGQSQLPSGEFRIFWSDRPQMAGEGTLDHSPFPTALIAYSLSFSDSSACKRLIKGATRFLQSEMLSGGVWRYWTPVHPYYKAIPPDADDTACASFVLRQNGVAIPDNIELLLANRDRQGRFYTWIVPHLLIRWSIAYWRVVLLLNPILLVAFFRKHEAADPADIDGVVNANVLAYVGESQATRAVIDYLINIIEDEKEDCCDKWHLNRFNFYYSLSRNFDLGISAFGSVRVKVVDRIESLANQDGSIGVSVLDTALAACSLLNWGQRSATLNRAIDFIQREQRDDGSWPRAAFYFGGPQYGGPDSFYGWGSEELTTGFCLEALTRYAGAGKSSGGYENF